ncbi:gliding motility-associated C-terminal domain-containing protein [Flavobacterium sp. C4GT6]|uniref:T9SS type B sorting domain-containing protein n=1 Tax=Flavobacterium sp. C4GT6 TaxID=3103818 RepID=UPI002ED46A06
MHNPFVKKYLLFYFFVVWIGFVGCANAQITISTPSIGFTQACASSTFNSYNFSFSFFPASNLGAGNQFIVELSDNAGSFTSPTTIATLTNTSSPVISSFALPTTAYGEGYRIRVKSTNPVQISASSAVFAAYYAVHNQPFAINSNISTVSLCGGGSYDLTIDDLGTPASPVYYPQLNYIWYKDYVEIPGETGSTLTVTEAGSYYAVTDYGSCNMDSYSNIVQVTVQELLTPTIQSQGGQTTICPPGGIDLTSVLQDPGYTYKWFKDDIEIPGETGSVYTATEGGVYHLVLTSNGCEFESNAITLDSNDFTLDIDPSVTTSIIPGETLTLTAITDANSPTVQWYKDNVLIAGETGLTLNITEPGEYRVSVSQTSPCSITKEATVNIEYPTSFNLLIQTSAYTSCVSTSVTLSIFQFDTTLLNGDVINLIGNSYGYGYQWYKDGVAVAGATGTTLALNDPSLNGSYVLKITLPGYGVLVSNTININLGVPTPVISGNTTLCEGGTVLFTSSISSAGYTYQWYRNGTAIPGATASTYTADAEGGYYLRVTGGSCMQQSNSLSLVQDVITVSSNNPVVDVILPGETKVLTVTTDANGPQYDWTLNGSPIAGTTGTINATQAGEYIVTVTQLAGCTATAQYTFTLEAPTSYDITINPDAGYMACTSTSVTLDISSFTGTTTSGTVAVIDFGYTYQWYKNGVAVAGANTTSLILNSASENGNYYLVVTLPGYGPVTSNTVTVNLAVQTVTITGGTTICEGSTTVLTSSLTAPTYSFQWYKDNVAIPGATAYTHTVDSDGDYYITVGNGTCNMQSNIMTITTEVVNITSTDPVLDVIIPGETKTLTVNTDANGPQYSWTRNGAPIAGTTSTINATQDGEYVVTVTQTVGCAATAQYTFVLEYPTSFNVSIATGAGYIACTSTSVVLNISSFTATTTSGTVAITDLGYAYQWYKNGVAVAGATSQVLTINSASENGNYYLVVTLPDYGPVTSNTVTINLAVETVTVTGGNTICEGATTVLTSNLTAPTYSFQWYKDNVAIPGATTYNYTVDAEGDYYVTVGNGTCNMQSNIVSIITEVVNITSTDPVLDIIMPGETKTLTVSTDADGPQYSWTRNGAPIAGTTSTINATQDGEYVVTVTQTVGCAATAQYTFVLEYPTGFSVTINPDAGYTACTSTIVTLDITNFIAITSEGNVAVTDMGYGYQWYKNGVAVAGATTPSLTLNSASQNGNYHLVVTLPDYGPVTSNIVAINLALTSVTISGGSTICTGGTTVLTSSLTAPSYTYQWYKDNVAIPGATASTYTANAEGDYYVTVGNGSCNIQSNVMTITTESISVNSTSPAVDVILPGQQKYITVTTDAMGPQYSWTRNGVPLTENTATLTATQDGEYTVTVTQTIGCNATAQMTFVLGYPTGFTITIAPDNAYSACTSASVTLSVSDFTAITSEGNIAMTDLGYAYQWFLNGVAIPGATSQTLTVNDPAQNGNYRLQVIMPGFSALLSNTVSITLSLGNVTLSPSGLLCPDNPQVDLTCNISDPTYTYAWYKDNVLVSTNNNSVYTATAEGNYYVVITTASCSFTSDTLNLELNDFNLIPDTPLQDVIIPGENKVLSVTTDALSPVFTWYKDGIVIPGGSIPSIYANTAGQYKIVVKQTEECNIVKELTFTLVYPSGFNIEIAPDGDFVECADTATALNIVTFDALTQGGPIDILNNNYGYGYQWYMDGTPITGATGTSIMVSESGTYQLQVTIPDFGPVSSNIITVNLGFIADVVIETEDVFCDEGATINITSNVNDSTYSYAWYKEGSSIVIGTESSITVDESGSYFMEVSFENCTISSNIIEVIPYDMSQIAVSTGPFYDLPEGTTSTITASGAESYIWYHNGVIVSYGPDVEVTEAGVYTVVATVGNCEDSRDVTVSLVENNVIAIPNTITPNNDGYNDKWALPIKYVNQENVEIVIYAADGKIVFRASNYMNNWPESDFTYDTKSLVYYYTIMEDNEITKRGSITIVE